MTYTNMFNLHTTVTIGALGMAMMAIFIRLKAANRPVTVKKIIIPPLGMSTGFFMFVFPMMRISWTWAAAAFLAGACVFAIPLILGTRFHVVDGKVYVKRSKSFVFILLGLLALRLVLHNYIEEYISIPQTGAVFFILAFGMILPWRVAMLVKYRRLLQSNNRM
jgi:membrane protein CcdC involved in cytochrome C biogenesis